MRASLAVPFFFFFFFSSLFFSFSLCFFANCLRSLLGRRADVKLSYLRTLYKYII